MITEEECKRRIEFATREADRARRRAESDLDAMRFEVRVAKWAVVGLLNTDKKPTLTIQGATLAQYMSDFEYKVARHLAEEFLRLTGLQFREHARMFELRRHVDELEGMLRGYSCTRFTPWREKEREFLNPGGTVPVSEIMGRPL